MTLFWGCVKHKEEKEVELTQEEIKKIEKEANACKSQARKKGFCYKAMKIVTTITSEEELHFCIVSRKVKKNKLLLVLKYYSRMPANFFQPEEIKGKVVIYYDSKLVFSGEREYAGFDEIKNYTPGGWEKEFFDLYNKLPEYEKKREEQKEQRKARELKFQFGL